MVFASGGDKSCIPRLTNPILQTPSRVSKSEVRFKVSFQSEEELFVEDEKDLIDIVS